MSPRGLVSGLKLAVNVISKLPVKGKASRGSSESSWGVSPLRTESQLTFSPEVGIHLLKFADLGCRLALFAWSRVRFGSGLRSDERPKFFSLSFRCIDLGFL